MIIEEQAKIIRAEFTKMVKVGKPKNVSGKTEILNLLQNDILNLISKGFSIRQIYKVMKDKAEYTGSYQTVRSFVVALNALKEKE